MRGGSGRIRLRGGGREKVRSRVRGEALEAVWSGSCGEILRVGIGGALATTLERGVLHYQGALEYSVVTQAIR